MTKAHPTENDVKAEVKRLLDRYGWHHWPASAGGFTTGGVSDRLAVRGSPGKGCIFLAVEVKLSDSKGTKLQEGFLADVRKQGGIGIVVNQQRLPRFEELLATIDRCLFPLAAGVPTAAFGDFGWSTNGRAATPGRRGDGPKPRSKEAARPAKTKRGRI